MVIYGFVSEKRGNRIFRENRKFMEINCKLGLLPEPWEEGCGGV